jgi:hypothetical protein
MIGRARTKGDQAPSRTVSAGQGRLQFGAASLAQQVAYLERRHNVKISASALSEWWVRERKRQASAAGFVGPIRTATADQELSVAAGLTPPKTPATPTAIAASQAAGPTLSSPEPVAVAGSASQSVRVQNAAVDQSVRSVAPPAGQLLAPATSAADLAQRLRAIGEQPVARRDPAGGVKK